MSIFGKRRKSSEDDPKPQPPTSTADTAFSANTLANANPRTAALFAEVKRGDDRAWKEYERKLAEWKKRNS